MCSISPSRTPRLGAAPRLPVLATTAPATAARPPDNAQAPVIDEPSGLGVVELSTEPDASPALSDGTSLAAQGDGSSSHVPSVSWDSGLRVSGDSEVGPAGGDLDDAETSDLFKAVPEPEPEDEDEDIGQMPRAPGASDGAGGEDACGERAEATPADAQTTGAGADRTSTGADVRDCP